MTIAVDLGCKSTKQTNILLSGGLFILISADASFGPAFDDEAKNWKYAVIIGIPVILAVIGVTGTVAIIYWAIKKGYIRHVPKSYDSFHNPVQFNNEGGQVHM